MSKYRIKKVWMDRRSYYYLVERRWFIFWEREKWVDTEEEALAHIEKLKDTDAKPRSSIVYKE